MWVNPTPTPRTKIFIDVLVDGPELKVSGGMSIGRSVTVPPNNEFLPLHASLLICRLDGCFALPFRQPPDHASTSSILRFVFSLLSISLYSRSTSFSGEVWSSCHECSLSLMICHSSSATRSFMFTISSPSSSGCVLSIKKSSPYLLYLMLAFLRPPLLASFIIGRSGSVHFGSLSCSGSFQS